MSPETIESIKLISTSVILVAAIWWYLIESNESQPNVDESDTKNDKSDEDNLMFFQ
jgi:hypothetical protein